jgi:hypothetical protein
MKYTNSKAADNARHAVYVKEVVRSGDILVPMHLLFPGLKEPGT